MNLAHSEYVALQYRSLNTRAIPGDSAIVTLKNRHCAMLGQSFMVSATHSLLGMFAPIIRH
jgi:hypothetical protein